MERLLLPDERLMPDVPRELLPDERLMPELPLEERLPEERLIPELPLDERLLPEERVMPELPLLERLLPEVRLTPELPRELPAEERLMPELPPEERLTPGLLEPEARELPPLELRVTRWASRLAIGAANSTTANTAKSVKNSFLGVNIDDLRPCRARQ
ncbi:MAG: hypothetical protein H6840_00020 [Planctomycetes bacterium]|nr:hypothetical protein [Planctomycetota bacterium]